MKLNLSKNSWFKAFGLINIILFIIIPINNLLSSNYLYVSTPPQVNNPLIINNLNKIMGIPTYVFYWEIIMISLLLVLYLFFRNKKTATN